MINELTQQIIFNYFKRINVFVNTESKEIFRNLFYLDSILDWKFDYSPDKYQFATGSSDGVLRIWNYDHPDTLVDSTINQSQLSFKIIPNPTSNIINLNIYQEQTNQSSIVLFDFLGKKIGVLYNGILLKGKHQFQYPTEELKSGIYFVNFVSGQIIKTEKVVILK